MWRLPQAICSSSWITSTRSNSHWWKGIAQISFWPKFHISSTFCYPLNLKFRKLDPSNWFLSNIKPFECETCHQCFIRKDHLISHQRTHSTEMFFCTLCNFKTTRNDSLKRHFKKHADIIDPNASIESYIQRIDTSDSRISPNSLLRKDFNLWHSCQLIGKFFIQEFNKISSQNWNHHKPTQSKFISPDIEEYWRRAQKPCE